ncbi:RNA signal recognition particle 4.5S RNA [alpha proteobacterium AAP81b]|nr:RNA signal recognition particle 4.5S RNA [alpha proteobacterium AAP81b]
MPYIDGFAIPVPHANRDAYLAAARAFADILREYGALQVVETWGDDIKPGDVTDFRRAVAAADDETVVFSWIVWPSRAERDAANARIMADPRMAEMEMAFDGKRLIMGGFEVIFEAGAWPAAA